MSEETTEKVAPAKRMAVIETFGPTLQGEGPLAGTKTMFVRFGGCDFRCVKCDSPHAVYPEAVKKFASYLTAEEIAERLVERAHKTGTPWVTLSGGNPCMWNLEELINILHGEGLLIALETQGSLVPHWVSLCDIIVLSPKSPGMGEKFDASKFSSFLAASRNVAKALKVVIFSQQDIEFALEVAEFAGPYIMDGMHFFSLGNMYPPRLEESPEDGTPIMHDPIKQDLQMEALMKEFRILTEDIVQDPRIKHWKFLPQLHVLAYGNKAEV